MCSNSVPMHCTCVSPSRWTAVTFALLLALGAGANVSHAQKSSANDFPAVVFDSAGRKVGPVLSASRGDHFAVLWRSPWGRLFVEIEGGLIRTHSRLLFVSNDCSGPGYVEASVVSTAETVYGTRAFIAPAWPVGPGPIAARDVRIAGFAQQAVAASSVLSASGCQVIAADDEIPFPWPSITAYATTVAGPVPFVGPFRLN